MEQHVRESRRPGLSRGRLGTFAGVFTPSILTILGIVQFLRLTYVVGNAGLGRAPVIIGLANIISVLTSVSLSAIATNLKVKGGGDYYLISRTLGVEFGGALSHDVMITDYGAMKRVAPIDVLIDAGVIAATLSSAMASCLGAPRILQSLARDRICSFLLPFAKGRSPGRGSPRGETP